MSISINNVASVYTEPGYMESVDYNQLASDYMEAGGTYWIAWYGTLLDPGVMFSENLDLPTVIARPVAINEWQSTMQVRAWNRDDTPDIANDFIDYIAEYDEQLHENDEACLDTAYAMLDEIFSM